METEPQGFEIDLLDGAADAGREIWQQRSDCADGPRAARVAWSDSITPRLYLRARSNASLSDNGSGVAVAWPVGTLPRNGFCALVAAADGPVCPRPETEVQRVRSTRPGRTGTGKMRWRRIITR